MSVLEGVCGEGTEKEVDKCLRMREGTSAWDGRDKCLGREDKCLTRGEGAADQCLGRDEVTFWRGEEHGRLGVSGRGRRQCSQQHLPPANKLSRTTYETLGGFL